MKEERITCPTCLKTTPKARCGPDLYCCLKCGARFKK